MPSSFVRLFVFLCIVCSVHVLSFHIFPVRWCFSRLRFFVDIYSIYIYTFRPSTRRSRCMSSSSFAIHQLSQSTGEFHSFIHSSIPFYLTKIPNVFIYIILFIICVYFLRCGTPFFSLPFLFSFIFLCSFGFFFYAFPLPFHCNRFQWCGSVHIVLFKR